MDYGDSLFPVYRSLNRLVEEQEREKKHFSYRHAGRRAGVAIASGSPVVLRGRWTGKYERRPLVAAYLDRSESWQNPERKQIGEDVVSMINRELVRRGKIDLEIRYFAEEVSDNPDEVSGSCTTYSKILDDIQQLQATNRRRAINVIIVTDSAAIDGNRYTRTVVSGGVIFLFCGGVSSDLVVALRGNDGVQKYSLTDDGKWRIIPNN